MEPIHDFTHHNNFYNHFHPWLDGHRGKAHIFYGDRVQLSMVDEDTFKDKNSTELVTEGEQKNWLEENNIAPDQYEILDIPKTDELKKNWRASFISDVKQKLILHRCPICTESNFRAYDWHAFGYNLVEVEEVDTDFLNEKLKGYNKDLYLLWEECSSHGLVMSSEIVRNCKWTWTDIYIFDDSFKWTFVPTHEELYYYKEI